MGLQTRLSIGDFSRMTHLSVKALRHYHDLGLLEPIEVDRRNGYRFYETGQVPVAQVIRRFRALGMPVEKIKSVIDAPDLAARNELIVEHLQHLERRLEETQMSVASLRALLEPVPAPIAVEFRLVPAIRVAAISEMVHLEAIATWWSEAFAELHAALRAVGQVPSGPAGGLYPTDLFTDEAGESIVYLPIADPIAASGRVRTIALPAGEFAVAVHSGSHDTADQTYGALGTFVAERAIGIEGPIRERYLVSASPTVTESEQRMEICWPIFQTAQSST